MDKIVVLGCGGHAKVLNDAIASTGSFEVIAYYDSDPSASQRVSLPVFHDLMGLFKFAKDHNTEFAALAIGSNSARAKLYNLALEVGFKLPPIIHGSAIISKSAEIQEATVVMANVVVNAAAVVGVGSILNTSSIVEHDCKIGSFCHIAPGSVLCGAVEVSTGSLIGARSVLIPGVKIGSYCTIGAGSVVIRDVLDSQLVYGCPVK